MLAGSEFPSVLPRASIMRRDLWFGLAFFCLLPSIVAGCGDEAPTASGGKAGGAGRESAAGGQGGAASDFKIVILTNGSSPFWDACDRGLKDAGAKLGVRVELVRNDATEGGQIRRLEQIATQRDVKGIGISVLESQASGVLE